MKGYVVVFNNITGDGKDVIFLSCNFMNSIQESYCDGEEKALLLAIAVRLLTLLRRVRSGSPVGG